MHQFDVPVDSDTHPQSKHKNKHNQTYSGFRCILHKAHLAHLLNLITLFTVSLHSWICESGLHFAGTAPLYIVAKITGDGPLSFGAPRSARVVGRIIWWW